LRAPRWLWSAAFLLYAVVLCGLVLFAAGTDAVASERVEAGKSAKACGDARKAGATDQELKDSDCEAVADEPSPAEAPPTVQDQRNDFLDELAQPLSTCLKLSRAEDKPDEGETEVVVTQAECARVAALVATFTEP
jgi:hypothetical protein